jgi:hypothetical protein
LSELNWFGRPSQAHDTASTKNASRQQGKLSDDEAKYVMALSEQHELEWEDNRLKGGAFWVLLADRHENLAVGILLEKIGFQFKPGTGYWIKG